MPEVAEALGVEEVRALDVVRRTVTGRTRRLNDGRALVDRDDLDQMRRTLSRD